MFEKFAKEARLAIVAAQKEARTLRSPDIRMEHLLLGLLQEAEPGLRALLKHRGVTRESVFRDLAAGVGDEPLGPADAEALRSIGIDLDAVRDSLAENFGADALDRALPSQDSGRRRGWSGHLQFTRDAKKALELSLREAVARKERTIESGHLLLGILHAPNPMTTELLGGGGELAGLRDGVRTLLDRAA